MKCTRLSKNQVINTFFHIWQTYSREAIQAVVERANRRSKPSKWKTKKPRSSAILDHSCPGYCRGSKRTQEHLQQWLHEQFL